jgi:hypothetical protein
MENFIEPRTVIEYLKDLKGVTYLEMQEKLGIGRGEFYAWRDTNKQLKRGQLSKRIMEEFAEHFEDNWMDEAGKKQANAVSIEYKYIQMLERSVSELEEEVKKLKTENSEMLRSIKERVEQIAGKRKP